MGGSAGVKGWQVAYRMPKGLWLGYINSNLLHCHQHLQNNPLTSCVRRQRFGARWLLKTVYAAASWRRLATSCTLTWEKAKGAFMALLLFVIAYDCIPCSLFHVIINCSFSHNGFQCSGKVQCTTTPFRRHLLHYGFNTGRPHHPHVHPHLSHPWTSLRTYNARPSRPNPIISVPYPPKLSLVVEL